VFPDRALRPRRATIGSIRAGDGSELDRGLALFFPGPASYTGEDVLELHVHGSTVVARDVLLATLDAGARLATPGEFTRRAYLAGKLDLCAAEAVADLIDAERRGAARAAAMRLAGGLSVEVARLRGDLREVLERLSAALDFPDEVAAPSPDELAARIDAVDDELARLAVSWETGHVVREGIAVAVVGPPNAGKSSLVNALLGVERVLVSPEAGTTRDTVEETLALGNGQVARLVDTAGLRVTNDRLEAAGIARSEDALERATVALVVVDGSRPLQPDARDVLVRTRGRERVVYYNKADLGGAGFDARDAAEADALNGTVRDPATVAAIRLALARRAAEGPADAGRASLGTARQAAAVLAARGALADARATLAARDPVDLTASDLLAADAALGELTGGAASDEVLDAIFARFCIGK
jgi:tRNA modification GTPase